MNRPHTSPYGASKAALEMATEVWANEVEETSLTINIVNPGVGANTPGMADEAHNVPRGPRPAPRRAGGNGAAAPLCCVARSRHCQWLAVRRQPLWDRSRSPAEAARRAGRPAGFEMHRQPA
jgi:3-oxoacyl-[acyl-carrier protein] reductase